MQKRQDASLEFLMKRFQDRLDAEAFEQIFSRLLAPALATTQQMLSDATLAEDAVQETFLRVICKRQQYLPSRPFSSWFYSILRNVCKDMLRHKVRYTKLPKQAAPRNAPHLKRWIVVACFSQLPLAMTLPFMHVFANEVKGAGQYVLSMMSVAMVVAHILFGIPLGRLADRLGRKRVIYLLTPLWYLSMIMLVLARGPAGLVLAGALWGFYPIMTVVTSSMTLELVPLEHMGRWSGLLGVFAGLVTVPAPLIAGLIWRHVGPVYVFIIPPALDIALRVPLLTTIPETLWKQDV